jgi:TBC1 domain family protein 5
MQRVLLIWSKENTDTSYRQGMHELLAPILLAVYRDAKVYSESMSHANAELDDAEKRICEVLAILLDEQFLEHDCFLLFRNLMRTMKEFFQVSETPRKVISTNSIT